ncbi:MAG TPA: membrane protein insertase YidC [Acetobacteraceae bacterium]|nr:membrane protein insertase YidC [Acetobacteraceae bacterium]
MDQKRLFTAILISVAILLGFQLVANRFAPPPPKPAAQTTQSAPNKTATPPEGGPAAGAPAGTPTAVPVINPAEVPHVTIAAPAIRGAISLVGARVDRVVLNDYRETDAPNSPDVTLLEPTGSKHPYFVQYGWSAAAGSDVKVPDDQTLWTASGGELGVNHPVTLSWNNGQGVTYQLHFSIDEHYMFAVRQTVKNDTGKPVTLYPWSRIRRDYTPETAGYYILFEGLLGVTHGTLQEYKYVAARDDAKKRGNDVAYEETSTGGWGGITDKYWLTALVPDQAVPETLRFRYIPGGDGHYQVDYVTAEPQIVAPGAEASLQTHLFTGAKVVSLLSRYENELHIPNFTYAVDFGWFWFLTKPIFYCLDWLNGLLGNFGLAIIVFTVFVKALFFPLANYSYRSMSKMRLLSPKIAALRERLKDEPQKMQAEMMALYRAEKVNPASGCLPMIVQIPVFFSLYKVIFVTIEMRQAPFFGWIHDLSQVDPTNVFTLFGLIPWDPTAISPLLHLGAWPLIMGFTMWLQQRLNPAPPDPAQAKMMQLMPVIFTFMLARFPAGLVIYWTWNNLLSVAQQWLIMRRTHLTRPGLART